MTLEENFRKLRNKWFNYHLYSNTHERVWETEEHEHEREEENLILKKRFDKDTEALIQGKKRCIAPICEHDMEVY